MEAVAERDDVFDKEVAALERAKTALRNEDLPAEERLKEFATLTRHYEKLLRQATKLTRLGDGYQRKMLLAFEEIDRQKSELAALDNEKNEFLGIVAHDLKNPLNIIGGYIAMILEEDDMEAAERAGYLRKAAEASRRMLELIKNLLDVNAIERGQMAFQAEPCDLAGFASQVVDAYRPAAAAKDQTIHYAAPPQRVVAVADESILSQLCDNLLSNAVKYSARGKDIWVTVSAEEDVVLYEVRDEGPGISEDDQKKLFGKFARLSARPTGGEHSTGLGLSIVKRLTEAMNGSVACVSRLGEGSRFILRFPRATKD